LKPDEELAKNDNSCDFHDFHKIYHNYYCFTDWNKHSQKLRKLIQLNLETSKATIVINSECNNQRSLHVKTSFRSIISALLLGLFLKAATKANQT